LTLFDRIWHWLIGEGLYECIVQWSVLTVLTAAAAWRPWRKHKKTQAQIIDLLRTDTPGGLAELAEILKEKS
jgi:hypothetical protein